MRNLFDDKRLLCRMLAVTHSHHMNTNITSAEETIINNIKRGGRHRVVLTTEEARKVALSSGRLIVLREVTPCGANYHAALAEEAGIWKNSKNFQQVTAI